MRKFTILLIMILAGMTISLNAQTKKPQLKKDVSATKETGRFRSQEASQDNHTWACLGPTGMPDVVTSSNTYGHGQINRLAFDPRYDGKTNQTIYGCSFFGGLWRSEDNGDNWQNVNTDFLPTTSVADVCINPFDPDQLFICTGYGDGGIYDARSPNWAHINPIYTTGIFRSNDYGQSWEDISGNFLNFFPKGGMCRKMAINPLNPDQIVVATTEGVIKTDNATGKEATWENVFHDIAPLKRDVRGIVFKPGDANIIYASGKDIFRSEDGGNSWITITGWDVDLDLENLPDNLKVRRINIAVTPAAPERLYAYILGDHMVNKNKPLGAHIALFENGNWRIIDTRFSSGTGYFADNWMAIAVSPVDGNAVYYANTKLIGSENIDSADFGYRSPYCGNGFHADVHDLAFQPNTENPKLFAANHGGVSLKTFPNPNTKGWEYKNEGLQVSLIWAFDDSENDEDIAVIGTQDNGTLFRMDTLGNMWHFVHGGDGSAARIDPENPEKFYYSPGDRSFYSFNLKTFKRTNEGVKLPYDPQVKKERVMTSKTTPMINYHGTGKPWFGFTELFSKNIDNPSRTDQPADVWTRQSDIYRSEPQGWRRQITEIAVCKSKPENIYVVTAGQQNSPWYDWQLPSGLYKSDEGGLNGTDADEIRFKPLDSPGKHFDNDTLPIITGIAVNPYKPDQVWITCTGIPPQFRVWFSTDGGESWKNGDPDGIFTDIPVNAIAWQEGSADRLYLGTDRGLYTRNRFNSWEKVKDFPNVRITEMKINYAFGKLRVATFGRGLWEGELLK